MTQDLDSGFRRNDGKRSGLQVEIIIALGFIPETGEGKIGKVASIPRVEEGAENYDDKKTLFRVLAKSKSPSCPRRHPGDGQRLSYRCKTVSR